MFGKKARDMFEEEEREKVKEMLGLAVRCPKCGKNLGSRDKIRGALVGGGIGLRTVCPHCGNEIFLR